MPWQHIPTQVLCRLINHRHVPDIDTMTKAGEESVYYDSGLEDSRYMTVIRQINGEKIEAICNIIEGKPIQNFYFPFIYHSSVGDMSYFLREKTPDAIELNERERTFRYIPCLDSDFVNDYLLT